MVNIEIAGIAVSLENKYPYIEKITSRFLTDKEPLFSVSAGEEDVERERKKLSVTAGYAESVVLYSEIAERLHLYDALVMHAAAIDVDGSAYLIAAKSGVGKTTHARLWLEAFGDRAKIINGDKPIIRKIDGELYAAGTPWCGKERLGGVGMSKIRGIAVLVRGAENRAEALGEKEAAAELIRQIYMPKSPVAIASSLSLLGELIGAVRTVRLCANMDISAARVSYNAMSANSEI